MSNRPPASPQALEEFARQQTNDPKGRGIARACWKVIKALSAQQEQSIDAARSASPQQEKPACSGCGGPHPFDVSVPSVLWNRVVRENGYLDYLCATCILRAFARQGTSFTAELSGDGFSGLPIEVRIDGEDARSLVEVNDENNRLRWMLRERGASFCNTCEHLKKFDATKEYFNCPVVNIRIHEAQIAEFGCTLWAAKEEPREATVEDELLHIAREVVRLIDKSEGEDLGPLIEAARAVIAKEEARCQSR